jgi:hypothetical protein
MSAARICDKRGEVFSERAEGWGQGQFTTMKRDERTGRVTPVTETIDLCPACNSMGDPVPQPQIAGVAEADTVVHE